MKARTFFVFLFLFSTHITALFSQKPVWNIYTFDDQPYFNVVLDGFANDTLQLKSMGKTYALPLKSIKILKRKRKSRAGVGLLTGMAAGGILLNLYSKASTKDQSTFPIDLRDLSIGITTTAGIIGGGIIGYLVGAGLGSDEYYNFSKYSYEQRKKIIEILMAREN